MKPLLRVVGSFLLALVLLGLFIALLHLPEPLLASPSKRILQQQQKGSTTLRATQITIPTYPYAHYLDVEHNAYYNITYHDLRWGEYEASNPRPTGQSYTLLVLENDYLKVSILPQVGGRIYELIYKGTGNNELYRNPVLKPNRWGPDEQDWWLAAGGIEWGLPVEEHGYEWGIPWQWTAVADSAGVTVTVRDTLAGDRLRARVDIFLPSERGYLVVRPRIENPTAGALDYKFWLNAMLAPGPTNRTSAGYEFVFNADWVSVHSTGDERLPGVWPHPPQGPSDAVILWPYYNGVDWSRLGNWDEWFGFFEYPQAAADFVGLYNHDAGEGVTRVFPRNVARGAKGFGMGWAHPIDSDEWTDDGSSYVELHGGVAPTFWHSAHLDAGASVSWTEYWYPVHATGGIAAATAEGTLGLRAAGESVRLGVHPTQAWEEGVTQLLLWDRASCALLDRQALPEIDPLRPHAVHLDPVGRPLESLAVGFADGEGVLLVADDLAGCTAPRLPAVLAVHPQTATLLVDVDERALFTRSLLVENSGYGSLTWTGEVADEGSLTPTLLVTQGVQGERLWFAVDTRPLSLGTYTAALTVTATATDLVDSPQRIAVVARIVPELWRAYLPLVMRE
jgi:hypothetical protein